MFPDASTSKWQYVGKKLCCAGSHLLLLELLHSLVVEPSIFKLFISFFFFFFLKKVFQ